MVIFEGHTLLLWRRGWGHLCCGGRLLRVRVGIYTRPSRGVQVPDIKMPGASFTTV